MPTLLTLKGVGFRCLGFRGLGARENCQEVAETSAMTTGQVVTVTTTQGGLGELRGRGKARLGLRLLSGFWSRVTTRLVGLLNELWDESVVWGFGIRVLGVERVFDVCGFGVWDLGFY